MSRDKLKDLIREFNAKERALKALVKVPSNLWTDKDTIMARDLRMQLYKLLSEIHKLIDEK